MPIISAFPTGESTVDYTGPKSGLPSLEEGKVAYVTDEKRLYTGNADGTNTQIPNADDVKTDVSDAVSSHNSATDAHAGQFAKKADLENGKVPASQLPEMDYAKTDLSNVTLGLNFKETALPVSADWRSVCYGNGKFVAVAIGTDQAAYSTDGITWRAATMPVSADWQSVCYGNGKFVAFPDDANAAAYSTDGITWKATTMAFSAEWKSVCYGNGKFVAFPDDANAAAYSTDGITWNTIILPEGIERLTSLVYGNGRFVAFAESAPDGDIMCFSLCSADGINWVTAVLKTHTICSAAYGNGKFVVLLEEGRLYAYSTDGVNWKYSSLDIMCGSLIYGNGRFFAFTSDTRRHPSFTYSTDGINWEKAALSGYHGGSSICYGNGKFVTVPYDGAVATYADDGSTVADQLASTGLARMSDVNAVVSAAAPIACEVNLTTSGWDSSAKTQTATVAGVLADESKQLIMPMPAGASMSAYSEAGIRMTAQSDNSVTFTADTVPTAAIDVWVVVQSVNDVTPPPSSSSS